MKTDINAACSESQNWRETNKEQGKNAESSRASLPNHSSLTEESVQQEPVEVSAHYFLLPRLSFGARLGLCFERGVGHSKKIDPEFSEKNENTSLEAYTTKIGSTQLCSDFQRMITSTSHLVGMYFQILCANRLYLCNTATCFMHQR